MHTPIQWRAIPLTCLILVMVWMPYLLQAQPAAIQVPQVTKTYALVNARVVSSPGVVLEKTTVIVRDGLIQAVGSNVAIPFDAERIAADSLVVYAGFIDGLSHLGIPRPKDDSRNSTVADPDNPSPEESGIQPFRQVQTMLDASEANIEKFRNLGFTMAHVVPHGRMLPGTGAVVLLAGKDARQMVVRGDASLFAQFETARAAYPSTEMAIIARMRQLYREAQRRQQLETQFAKNPAGMTRPEYDPVHYAFFPVINGKQPVFFHTRDALDVYRVLDLRNELGFKVVLTGLAQGYELVPTLQKANTSLLLTLDLPEDKSAKKKGAAKDSTQTAPADTTQTAYNPDLRVASFANVKDEKKNLEARQALEREKYYATAAKLHEAGLRFGFMTMDVKPENVMKHLRKMVASGLPKDEALAALTTHPAEILGLGAAAGTVTTGKMANLVVTTGDLFEEKTKVRYVFVGGQKYEMAPEKKKAASGEAPASVAGSWDFTVETPDGPVTGTLTLQGNGRSLQGTITHALDPGNTTNLEEVTLDGKDLSFGLAVPNLGRVTVRVKVDGDSMEGTADVPDVGGLPFTGKRTSSPQ